MCRWMPGNGRPRGEIDVKLSKLRHSLHAEFWKLAADKNLWHRLSPDEATSTGSAELRIQETTGGSEIVADGTLSANSQYTVEFPLGQNQKLTALKIEVLPKDLEAASRTPEPGFVLSHLRAYLIGAKEQPREIDFQLAVCDEAEPFFDPQASLRPDPSGWGAYSRISQPHSAVFIPKEPIQFEHGERLRLVLLQNKTAADSVPMIIQRLGLRFPRATACRN